MRKTALVGLAALAASALTMMAQSNVYSLNVVGYVNAVWSNSLYYSVCAPLDAGTSDLNTLIPSPPNGSIVQTWNVSAQDFDSAPCTYKTIGNQRWVPNRVIPAGKGFFIFPKATMTNTWVGNVLQGSLTNVITGNSSIDFVGSMVPIGGDLNTNIMVGYAANNGDIIQHWNVSKQDYDSTPSTYKTIGNQRWTPNYTINVGEAFQLINKKPGPYNWVRNFTVP